jgi:hypothetical protein
MIVFHDPKCVVLGSKRAVLNARSKYEAPFSAWVSSPIGRLRQHRVVAASCCRSAPATKHICLRRNGKLMAVLWLVENQIVEQPTGETLRILRSPNARFWTNYTWQKGAVAA